MIRLLSLGFLAVAVLLSGCGAWTPVPEPGVTLSSDRHGSSQLAGSLKVTVRLTAWREGGLHRLVNFVTPVYIQVQNGGAETVSFDPAGVTVVDDEGTLFHAIPPERLEALLSGHGVSYDPLLGPDPVFPYDLDAAATLAALTAGPVAPGTQVRGAVYFPRTVSFGASFTVRVPAAGEILEFRFRAR